MQLQLSKNSTDANSIYINPNLLRYLEKITPEKHQKLLNLSPVWLKPVDLNPWKALGKLGLTHINIMNLKGLAEYTDAIRLSKSWAIVPLLILTPDIANFASRVSKDSSAFIEQNDLLTYALSKSDSPVTVSDLTDPGFDKEHVILKEATYFMGSGYVRNKVGKGTPLIKPRLISLSTGDTLIVLMYEWHASV